MIVDKFALITEELGDLERKVAERGNTEIRYHDENSIRRAIKHKLKAHGITMEVPSTKVNIISSNSIQAGDRIFNAQHVKAEVELRFSDGQDERTYLASGAAPGDNFANASSAAITYAVRDWMRVAFQITYDPTEDEDVIERVEQVVLSESTAEDCRLIVSRHLADLKKEAKKIGFKPGSWAVTKMDHDDLFRLSTMAVHLMNSKQGDLMQKVGEKLESTST